MIIEMGYSFNRNGATLPVELVEQIDDAKDYPDVVEFAEPVKIEGTLKNEDDVFVLDAKGETAVLMECSCCLAPVRKELCSKLRNVLLIQAEKTKRQKLLREIRSILRIL